MKKLFNTIVVAALFCSCATATSPKPDKRDKYVGEYKLYEPKKYWGEYQSVDWNSYTSSYDWKHFNGTSADSSRTLVVTKNPNDTISLIFDIVIPFDFERQKGIIALNEDIKKRNEQSICGKDEELKIVPQPTYTNGRDLVESYTAYIEGQKIFINDTTIIQDYYGSGYKEKITFDSVYLMNDTMHFIKASHADIYVSNKRTRWQNYKCRCLGFKIE